jgi:NAD(P)H-dependent FMN reductase
MKVLSFAGSLRTESTNKKLAREALRLLSAPLLARAEFVDLRGCPMPVYVSASPGGWGGIRGLWHSRVPFEALGVHVFPEMMSLPNAGSAFDEIGHLRSDRAQQLHNLVGVFAGHASARIALRAA